MPNRRSFLLGASAVLASGATGAALVATRTGGQSAPAALMATRAAAQSTLAAGTALPLTIVNHTYRYTNAQVWIYVVGTDLNSGQQTHVRPDGSVARVSLADNGPDGYADLSVPLVADGDTSFAIPADMSGRIYVSTGSKLRFRVVADGAGNPALQYPAGWVSGDPSYSVLHDFVEFTHTAAGFFCNTTMVDMFSVPMSIRLRGAADQTTGTLAPGGRHAIFAGMSADPTFAPLVVDDLRVIAPGHGIDSGIFPATYYDSYVDAVWNHYASRSLVVTVGPRTYTGTVTGDMLRFDGGIAPFAKPSTQAVFYCDGALAAPNDGVTGPVAAVLGAAFNRSTLLTNPAQPTTDPGTFYRHPVTNHYSRIIHQNTVDGKAYGFPFDDVANLASYVQDSAPRSVTLSLTPF